MIKSFRSVSAVEVDLGYWPQNVANGDVNAISKVPATWCSTL